MSYCPECEAEIEEEFDDIGEIFSCPECGIELEVISLEPLEFDLAPIDEDEEDDYRFEETDEEEEDWDDEDSYDEEEESDEEEDY